MAVKVSVVVPVYNPGEYIDACIQSLLAQSLPAAELELLLVNDGSTDDTLERLEAYAAAHHQIKILSIPNSGWPGKPRNVGTDAAAGEYVMYVDQDDRLEPESLQRMYEMGSAHHADVVLGKVISDFRGVHHSLYRRSRPDCTVYTANLMNSLTPHKMLRTAFLREQNIRYAEGPRRLEDQLFMTKAYFAATTASIVADYVCYRYLRRSDGKNAGSKRIIPAEYYGNLDEVLDVVDAYTDPGEVRHDFYRRFLRTEMLGRLDAPKLLDSPETYRTSLLAEIRRLLTQRFPPSVDSGLGTALRCRAALTRAGSLESIAAQAESFRKIRVDAQLRAVEVTGQEIHVDIEACVLHDGAPLTLDRDSELGWLLPVAITDPVLSEAERRVEDLAEMSGDVVIKHRELGDEWFLPSTLQASIESDASGDRVFFRGTAVVDPQHAAGGRCLRKGVHDLYVRTAVFGLTRNARLDAGPTADLALPVLVDDRRHIHRPYSTAQHKASVNVDALPKWLSHAMESATFVAADSASSADEPVLDLGVRWTIPPSTVTLTVTTENGRSQSWKLLPHDSVGTQWRIPLSDKPLRLPLGEHRARVSVAGAGDPVKATLQTPFAVTSDMRRARLPVSVRDLAGRGARHLMRRVRRVRRETP